MKGWPVPGTIFASLPALSTLSTVNGMGGRSPPRLVVSEIPYHPMLTKVAQKKQHFFCTSGDDHIANILKTNKKFEQPTNLFTKVTDELATSKSQ